MPKGIQLNAPNLIHMKNTFSHSLVTAVLVGVGALLSLGHHYLIMTSHHLAPIQGAYFDTNDPDG